MDKAPCQNHGGTELMCGERIIISVPSTFPWFRGSEAAGGPPIPPEWVGERSEQVNIVQNLSTDDMQHFENY